MKTRKKKFIELSQVESFIASQPAAAVAEYREIVEELECKGTLAMPLAEKISGRNLFAIRVIQTENLRVFYVYGCEDKVYGIYGYVKKAKAIPQKEMKQANRVINLLRQEGLIK